MLLKALEQRSYCRSFAAKREGLSLLQLPYACLNYLEKLKTKNVAKELYYKQLEQSEESALNKIMETEVIEMLIKEIELLPEKCREVFKLLYFEHEKADEIAEQLDISHKTVRAYKAKAIELLKASVLRKGISEALLFALQPFLDHH